MAKDWQTAADFPVQGYYDESGFIDTGGGSNVVPVFSDGTNWRIG